MRRTPRSLADLTPQALAELAVAHFTPAARSWVAQLHHTYPGAPVDGLVRLATRAHVRAARAAGLAAVLGGPLGPLTSTAALLVVQARLVVHIAAAYGVDADPAEVLMLTGLHSPTPTAGLAATKLAGWTALRTPSRVIPGMAIALGMIADARSVEWVGIRAANHYRKRAADKY